MAQSFDQVSGEGRFAGVTSYKIRSDKSRAAVAAAPRVAKLQPNPLIWPQDLGYFIFQTHRCALWLYNAVTLAAWSYRRRHGHLPLA